MRVPSFYADYLFDVYRYYLGIFHSFMHEFATQKLQLAYYFAYLKELKLYGNPHDLIVDEYRSEQNFGKKTGEFTRWMIDRK